MRPMNERARVLFLCTGNSCRSQMAEGWLRHLAGERFESLSAGTDPQGLNPRAVAVMGEVGVDIAEQRSQSIDGFPGEPPELVVTVCDRAAAACPTFPGAMRVVHWPFPDPAGATGSEEEILAQFRAVRDSIRARLDAWLESGAPLDASA